MGANQYPLSCHGKEFLPISGIQGGGGDDGADISVES